MPLCGVRAGLEQARSAAALVLGIAVSTVRTHLKAAMAKIGAARRPELAALLRRLMR